MDGETVPRKFRSNKISNTKYNIITFIPLVLLNQFKFFFNLFFLIIALTQFIPPLRVGKLIHPPLSLSYLSHLRLFVKASCLLTLRRSFLCSSSR